MINAVIETFFIVPVCFLRKDAARCQGHCRSPESTALAMTSGAILHVRSRSYRS